MNHLRLAARIQDRSARIGIIGQGYVGLPLAVEFARAGYNVVGVDTEIRNATWGIPAPQGKIVAL